MDALARGRILPVKPSNAIGWEQDAIHPDSQSAVVRKLVPKLADKVAKFRYRNELSATFLTHLDKFAVRKPTKSASTTTPTDDESERQSATVGTSLPKL